MRHEIFFYTFKRDRLVLFATSDWPIVCIPPNQSSSINAMRVVSLEITGSGYSDWEQDPGGFSRGSTGVGGVVH